MSIQHVIFIPGVFLLGLVVGYSLGAKAVRNEAARREQARKR